MCAAAVKCKWRCPPLGIFFRMEYSLLLPRVSSLLTTYHRSVDEVVGSIEGLALNEALFECLYLLGHFYFVVAEDDVRGES